MDAQGNNILKGIGFSAPKKQYSLEGDKVEVRLSAPETRGLKIDKVYTFTKGSYLVNVRFDIANGSGQTANLSADYRIGPRPQRTRGSRLLYPLLRRPCCLYP
uniref:Membrane protein insertase YidC n=1 Tax=Neisseria meningitidis alpha275 TaxID=295996 RepID=C6SIA4_NEIME|nr:probable inner-membrane protein [Neisseria meningitidis alpha275]